MLELAGCAARTPAPPVAPAPLNDLMAALNDRERQLTTLQSDAVMEYSGSDGHLKVREQLTVARPASLRVEAESALGVALVVTANANEIAVFDPGRDTLARGAASAATLERVAHIPMRPEEAVRLLLALPPNPPDAPVFSDHETVLTTGADGVRDELFFSEGNLAEVRETSASGALLLTVAYRDYRDIGSLLFPCTIEATFPAEATTIRVRYGSPLIDLPVAQSTFVLSPGPRTREISLGRNDAPPHA